MCARTCFSAFKTARLYRRASKALVWRTTHITDEADRSNETQESGGAHHAGVDGEGDGEHDSLDDD